MSSTPSRIASNWSLGVLMGSNSLAAIRFPLGWNSKVGPVFVWYEQLSCTKFVSIQHRKEREAPFHHEFLCAKLNDGNLCRFERFGDPDARTDALTEQGSAAHDLAEILPANQLATFDTTSDLLEEIRFPQEIDIMDVLEICYNIQQDKQTRTYTLQRYNCYFFCWCVLLLLTRKLALWEKTLLGIWDRTIQQLESDLFKAAPTDQDSLVFLLCRWLAPNTSRPEGFVIRALCDELSRSRASTLKRLCAQLELTLWEYDWQGAIQGELSNAEKIAGWAERQAPISAVPNLMQDSAESHYEGTGIQSSASRKSRFGWMRKAMDMVKNMSGDAAVDDAHAHPSDKRSVQAKLKELLITEVTEGSAQRNLEVMMHMLEAGKGKEAEWDALWTQAVGDLLNKYLTPSIIQSILVHEPKSLRVTYLNESSEQEMVVSQLQRVIQAHIVSHASRVDRVKLGSEREIQSDVKETVKRVFRLMSTEEPKKSVTGGLESGLASLFPN